MRGRRIVVGFVALALLICTPALSQDTHWLMYGTVTWRVNSPAASVKLRLLQGGKETRAVYTNQEGRYGFYDVAGRPSDYTLEVWFGDRLLKTYLPRDLQRIPRGGRNDIQLQ